jgi:putative membrane protein
VPFIGHFYALVLTIAFFGIVIVAAVWLVLWAIRASPQRIRPDNALGILNERFARGEIDQQEYETRKAALLRRRPAP